MRNGVLIARIRKSWFGKYKIVGEDVYNWDFTELRARIQNRVNNGVYMPYINPTDGRSKEQFLTDHGVMVGIKDVIEFDFKSDKLPVCLVDNGSFTAAGIAFCKAERDRFLHPDRRPKLWFVVDKSLLEPFLAMED